ncbi:MAG: hypothetical protein ABMA14_07455 [Hyphomonadaceae bacterium]
MKYAAFAAALALAACQPATQEATKAAEPVPPAAAPAPAAEPAKPSGPARTVAAETVSDDLSGAASVTDIHFVKDADVKLFSTAGGDPAINGLYTYLALFTAPEGWTRVYMIGDFNSWNVVEESPTRVVLKVSRSWIEEGTGDVKTADEKLILDIPQDEASPLTVTPAA